MDIIIVFGTLVILVEILTVRPDIHVENRRIEPGDVVHSNHRLFSRGHTANRRAVFISAGGITRADALYPCDSLRLSSIRETNNMAFERSGGREHPLELHACHNVRISPVAELALSRSVKFIESGSKQYRTDVQLDTAFGHRMVDGILAAGRSALFALRAQSTIETPFSLGDSFFFREARFYLIKVADSFLYCQLAGSCSRLLFDIPGRRQKLFRNRLDCVLETTSPEVLPFEITLDRFGGTFACCYRLDYGCGTGDRVTSCENALYRRLECDRIGYETAALGLGANMLKKKVVIFLADCNDYLVGVN